MKTNDFSSAGHSRNPQPQVRPNLLRKMNERRILEAVQAHGGLSRAELVRLTHALSGSASSMGATSLAALCKKFAMQLKTGMMDDLEARIGAIEDDYRKIDRRLQAMLETS